MTLDSTKLHVLFDSDFELLVDNEGSIINLGGNAEQAVIESLLQGELGSVKDDIDQLKWKLGAHRHPVQEFPMPLLFGDIVATFKQPAIYLVAGQPPINIRTGGEAKSDNAPMDDAAGAGEYFGAPIGPTPADLFPGGHTPSSTASSTVSIKS